MKKIICKNCGYKEEVENISDSEEFSFVNENDPLQETICTCNNCGKSGIESNFVQELNVTASASVGGKTDDASDKAEPVDSSDTRTVDKKYRKKPERRIQHNDSEKVRGTVAMNNPFLKKSQFNFPEGPAQAIEKGKIEEIWIDPHNEERLYKLKTNGEIEFSNDRGENWIFSKKSPDEILEQGFISVPSLYWDTYESLRAYLTRYKTTREYGKKERERFLRNDPEGYNKKQKRDLEEYDRWAIESDNENKYAKYNPFLKKSRLENNPFVKTSREFKRSPWGQFMKELSENNMTFPENPPGAKGGKNKSKGDKVVKDSSGEPFDSSSGAVSSSELHPTFEYNPVDRKEYRSSPKRRDLEPGQAEWEDKEIDKYYDGWVDDHIENSGGKVIGSNTPEKNLMNLNGEQREKDLGNRDLIYERLLENRHLFNDDYKFIEVAEQDYKISKEAAKLILASKVDDNNVFISKGALDIMLNRSAKKKSMKKKASKFPLLSIPI